MIRFLAQFRNFIPYGFFSLHGGYTFCFDHNLQILANFESKRLVSLLIFHRSHKYLINIIILYEFISI
jgi:hypothetical protein